MRRQHTMYWTITRFGSEDCNGRCYKIRVTKAGCMRTRTKRYVKFISISAEDIPRNEVSKTIQPKTEDRFYDLGYQFTQLHKHGHSNEMEAERSNTMTSTHFNIWNETHLPRHTNVEHVKWLNQRETGHKTCEKTEPKLIIKKLSPWWHQGR